MYKSKRTMYTNSTKIFTYPLGLPRPLQNTITLALSTSFRSFLLYTLTMLCLAGGTSRYAVSIIWFKGKSDTTPAKDVVWNNRVKTMSTLERTLNKRILMQWQIPENLSTPVVWSNKAIRGTCKVPNQNKNYTITLLYVIIYWS